MIKKSPYLFLLYFESMYYSYLPCLILSHDFDEQSDFLNYEFSKRLPAITQFKNGLVQKRELGRPNSLLNSAIFELSNGGQFYRQFEVQKFRLLVKIMA